MAVRHVEAFNGVDAAIQAIFDAYAERGDTLLTTVPTFGYYEPCAQQQGMMIDEVPYLDDLKFPLEAVARRLEARPRLCFICNPNNPTGTLMAPSAIVALARVRARDPGSRRRALRGLHRTDGGSGGARASERGHATVAVEGCGLAALRLGFAIGHPSIVERLRRVTGPYDINMFAVVAGKAALADEGHMRRYVAEVLAARAWTIDEMRRLGVRCSGEGGNYILVWPPGKCEDVVSAFRDEGILVRSMAGKPLIDGSFRLTIGTREDMRRFMAAFARRSWSVARFCSRFRISRLGTAPTSRSFSAPSLKKRSCGIAWIPKRDASAGCSSTLTLPTVTWSPSSLAISSSTGPTTRQGPHHGAQKSITTGRSLVTTPSNVASVTFT